jgi:hypothetical protein
MPCIEVIVGRLPCMVIHPAGTIGKGGRVASGSNFDKSRHDGKWIKAQAATAGVATTRMQFVAGG